jgi:uncharacterized repeat protein (TIGR03833 family)
MSVPKRSEIQPGMRVQIVEKQNQGTGTLTEGIVVRLLTKSPTHPHGIKVVLAGRQGRPGAGRSRFFYRSGSSVNDQICASHSSAEARS